MFTFSMAAAAGDVKVLTFNIRYDNPRDGADAWPNRREAVAKEIARADVAGLQEVKPNQRAWLRERLPEFEFIGIGREKDDTDEAVPVAIRKERFELEQSGTFWLSETPEVPASKSWDSSLPRICTWVRLRDRRDGSRLALFNVHLDHRGSVARDQGIAVVLGRMEKAGVPTLLTGDFNCGLNDAPVKRVSSWQKPALVSGLVALEQTDEGTFNGFTARADGPAIDYIFAEKDRVKFVSRTVVKTKYTSADGTERQVSDHYPVAAVVSIAGK
jgi:endonuclease/exonuclease/phosphatase family metal-dependent hydrolase